MQDFFPDYLDSLKTEETASTTKIHPSAVVSRGAELGKGVSIGPGAVIGAKVVLEDGVRIGAGAVLEGRTRVGQDTRIFSHASVGSCPQDLKYRGEDSELIVGKRNLIREYVNISLGTEGGGGRTVIGDDNLIMVYTHIGHDCVIGNHCIFANGVQLAGHVIVGNGVVFGGLSAAHQFSQFGDLVMVAAGAMVSQDVPPYCMVHGNHARINGLNVVGLRRAKIKNLSAIKAMYRIVYNENFTLDDARAEIEASIESSEQRETFLEFLKRSERGICR